MHSKNLSAFLVQAEGIDALMPQAKRLLALRQVLFDALPESLGKNSTVANYRQGRIVLYAANAAIAAKIKLLRPALVARYASMGLEVTVMDIEVQPAAVAETAPRKAAVLSPNARRALAELVSQLPESELKSAIAAIASQDVSDH